MSDGSELTDDQVEDSLEEQGFNPVWDSERWNEVLENSFKDEVADDEVVDDGSLADEAAPQAAVEAADTFREGADSAGGYIDIAGTQIPESEAERVARFWDWMNQNPDQAMDFVGYMVGDYELVPRGTAPQQQGYFQPPPQREDIDDEDWDLLPDSVQKQLKKIGDLEETLHYQQDAIAWQQQVETQRSQAQASSHVELAKNQFATRYDLDAATMSETVETAARLNVVPALMAETQDPIAAVYRALEISYSQSETGRERELNRRLVEADTHKQRQRKMAAVGGTGGNVPRTTENLPNTKEGRRDAMVNEIAAAIRGG